MDRKTKLMAACAIGAVAILLGAGLARCAMAPNDDGADDEKAAVEQQADGSALSAYVGTAWTSGDGKSYLAILDGALVEKDGTSTEVTYYEADGEAADDGGLSVDISTWAAATDTPKDGVLRIDASDEAVTATCDAFKLAGSYVLDADAQSAMALARHSEELNDLLQSDDAAIESAIGAWAAKRSPYATTATWDGEVYIDCNGNTVTTGFALDDGAGTVVQLVLDRGTGKLSTL